MAALALRLTRLALYAGLTLLLMPVQALLVRLVGGRAAIALPMFYHRLTCRIVGFSVERRGEMSRHRPTLFVANHISYTDIEVLGSVLPASFVAKADVAGWPVFGRLAKLQRTVFVDRRVRSTAAQKGEIERRLAAGDSLIFFPEGTSGDGNRVLPFKSALFAAAETGEGRAVAVQPVSIAYTKLDGIPLGRADRAEIAWYGDMEMAPHLWHLLGLGVIAVVVEFHPPVTLAELGSRKALSEHCHRVVSAGVAAALSGRLGAPPPRREKQEGGTAAPATALGV